MSTILGRMDNWAGGSTLGPRRGRMAVRAVLLTLILSLVLVVGGFAAWLLQSDLDVSAFTRVQPPSPDVANAYCNVDIDASQPGASCTASFVGSTVTLDMNDVDPGDKILLGIGYNNPVGTDLYAGVLDSADPTFAGAFIFTDANCGTLLPTSGAVPEIDYFWELDGASSDPGTLYGPLTFTLPFSEVAPTCP